MVGQQPGGARDWPAAVDSDVVSVNGHAMHYLHAGSGDPTLVLLHGGQIDAARLSWHGYFDELASEARVVAPDLLGYGRSDLPAEPLSQDYHIRAVSRFLDELGIESAVIAGVSMGGGIGIGLALEQPDRVERLVAIDAYGLGSELPNGKLSWVLAKIRVLNKLSVAIGRRSRGLVKSSLEGITYDSDRIADEVIDELMVEINQPNAGAAFRSWREQEVTWSGYRTDFTPRLPELSVPTRFVHGDHDQLFPVEWARRAADRTPDADLFILDDCGHWSTQERPEEVRRLVREVL